MNGNKYSMTTFEFYDVIRVDLTKKKKEDKTNNDINLSTTAAFAPM